MNNERLGLEVENPGVGARQTGVALGAAFAVGLAVMIAKEMSPEAMAVVIGVICGIAAGLPAGVLLLVVLTRRQRVEEREQEDRRGSYPRVVVIQSGAPRDACWSTPSPVPAAHRQFQIVGGNTLPLSD
ncbi:hypothetical protein ACFLWA_04050 [Chloroflexota bacterium]